LARREYSRDELRQKLISKAYPTQIIDAIIDELNREGLQSDARFAEAFIRSRLRQGYGVHRIQHELSCRGIRQPALDEYLPNDAVDWMKTIEAVHAKKFGARLPRTQKEFAARARFLQRRGFTLDQINSLFKRLKRSDEPA
jgi:regulatory protein